MADKVEPIHTDTVHAGLIEVLNNIKDYSEIILVTRKDGAISHFKIGDDIALIGILNIVKVGIIAHEYPVIEVEEIGL